MNLGSTIYLNEDAQASMEVIKRMEYVPSVLTWKELPDFQPFVLPQRCYYDGHLELPDQCKSRYIYHNYNDSIDQ